MKKLLIFALLTMVSFPAFSWEKVIRENRGVLGYKTVAESSAGPNKILACSDPGNKSCAWKSPTTPGGQVIGTILNNAIWIEIDRIIDARILALAQFTGTEGAFYYGSGLYVEYTYDYDADKIETIVYTTEEAHDLGRI